MQAFTIEVVPSGVAEDIVLVKVNGELDVHTVPEMDRVVKEQFEQGICKMVFNLEGLTYSSSAGIGILMSCIKLARSKDGDIKLSHLQPRVHRVLDLLGFTKIFEIYENNAVALEAFSK